MDYETLLKKYMRFIRIEEGIDYVGDIDLHTIYKVHVEFTPDERAELERISAELDAQSKASVP